VLGAALIASAVSLALVCVRHRGRWPDRVITAAATAAYSVPSLVLAALLRALLGYKWQLFPVDGYVPLTEDPLQWAWPCCCRGSPPRSRSPASTSTSSERRCSKRLARPRADRPGEGAV
jgi:ABC-type dipeptide/oligopeptide/nickel transport system permease component